MKIFLKEIYDEKKKQSRVRRWRIKRVGVSEKIAKEESEKTAKRELVTQMHTKERKKNGNSYLVMGDHKEKKINFSHPLSRW